MSLRKFGLALFFVSLPLSSLPSLNTPSIPQQKKGTGLLALKDGRFIFDRPMKKVEAGVEILFPHGKVVVPERLIADFYNDKLDLTREPRNEKERQKIEKGYVFFQKRWVKKKVAQKLLARILKKRKKDLEERKAHTLWRNRYIVKTKDFTFEHNIPPELFENLKSLFQVYLKTFMKKWKRKPELAHKPVINLYANIEDYRQISGASGGIVGWYSPSSNQLHFFWDFTDPASTLNTMFHETNHMLADMINGDFRYPAWIEEPMAEYYGGSKWDPKKKKITPGQIQPGRLTVVKLGIKEGKTFTLKQLFRMERFGAVHYAWGWTFIHFLMKTPKYAKRFEKFYLDLAHKKGIKRKIFYGKVKTVTPEVAESLLLKYLKVKSLDQLQKEWMAYVKKLQVNSLEGMERAGTRFIMFGEEKMGRKLLEKAVKMGAKSPVTYTTLAQALYRTPEERRRALALLDKAAQIDPLFAVIYYRKGQILGSFNSMTKKKEGLRNLYLASEIEPDNWKYQNAIVDLETEIEEESKGSKKKKDSGSPKR